MVEIRQELGIDVSQAVRALDQLDRRLEQFGGALDKLGGKLKSFNTAAKNAFKLGNLTGDLDKAASSTQRVVRGFAGFSGAATTAGSAAQTAASSLNTVATASNAAATAAINLGASTASGTVRASSAFKLFSTTATTALAKVRGSISRVGASVRAFGANSAAAIGKFSLSFQTLGRIISAQVIIRGINAIGQAFREAVTDAIDFQITISEIQTIAQSSFRDFSNAANQVRALSDAFNVSLGDVGEGLYQTISNQIQGAAGQVEVLTQALILSKVGVATAADSVALLTGTLNAFQKDASEAESVVAVLFKTVELGRVRISELAKSFGTVATLANEAGASVEELAAAFATVTINGIDTAKAATQIRGIFNAIIKPTKELKAAFEEAGFAEGTLALETLGLVKTLNLISDAADGSQEKLAKLIPRLRGITGQLILARDGGEKFQEQLDKINKAAAEGIKEEFEIRIETNAERVTKLFNELKNVLTVDLGQAILEVLGFFTRFENATQSTIRVVQILSPLIVATTTFFGLYAAAAGIAALATTAFGASAIGLIGIMGGVPAILAAGFLLTIGAIKAADSSAKIAADNVRQIVEKAAQDRLSEARKTRAELVRIEKDGIRERFGEVTDFVRRIRVALAGRVKAWKESNEKIVSDSKTLFGQILNANKQLVSNLKKSAADAGQAQIDSISRVNDLRIQGEDAAFKASLRGRNAIQQSFLQQRRAAELGRKAAEQLGKAQTNAEIEVALAIAERAKSAAAEAVSTADSAGNRASLTRALRTQSNISNDLVRAEERLQSLQSQRESSLRGIAQKEEARVNQLEESIKKVLELQDEFDPSASPIKREAILKEVQAALKEVGRLSIPKDQQLDAASLIDLAKFKSTVLEAFKVSEIQGIDIKATLTGESQSKLSKQISDTVAEAFRFGINKAIESGIDPSALTKAIGAQGSEGAVAAVDALTRALNAERDNLTQIETNAEKVRIASEDLATAAESAAAQLKTGLTTAEAFRSAIQKVLGIEAAAGVSAAIFKDKIGPEEAKRLLLEIGEAAARLPLETFNQTTEEINKKLQDINKRQADVLSRTDRLTQAVISGTVSRLAATIKTAQEAIDKSVDNGTQTAEQLRDSYNDIKPPAKAVEDSTKNAATEAGNFQGAMNAAVSASTTIAQAATVTANQLKIAADASKQISSGGGAQNVAFGGLIHRAGGGFTPSGTDTVPAMLSPGEFVVNAKSSRRFFSQLQSINSGVQPRFLQEGGPVTTFGDINVTVSGSEGGEATGRQIARSLRREVRRRTINR